MIHMLISRVLKTGSSGNYKFDLIFINNNNFKYLYADFDHLFKFSWKVSYLPPVKKRSKFSFGQKRSGSFKTGKTYRRKSIILYMWLFCLDIVILPCNGKGSDHLTQFEGGKCYIHVLLLHVCICICICMYILETEWSWPCWPT